MFRTASRIAGLLALTAFASGCGGGDGSTNSASTTPDSAVATTAAGKMAEMHGLPKAQRAFKASDMMKSSFK